MTSNPCLSCGACCAFYRATFYWAECTDAARDGVPVELTENLPPFRRVMKGTNCNHPRCIALEGEIGREVHCSIYAVRSTTCREFPPSFEKGARNERCDAARAAHGLAPLSPLDWVEAPAPPLAPAAPLAVVPPDPGDRRDDPPRRPRRAA